MIQNKAKTGTCELEWRDDTLPVSVRFDDPYFSKLDGRAETGHVFIEGNDLPTRFPVGGTFTIAELGFGTGLNFLETWDRWKAIASPDAKLVFISFEQFPMSAGEMQKALSTWPELKDLAKKLVAGWNCENDVLILELDPNVILKVHFADANLILPDLKLEADAWYLDGFSPAKNPELWNADLMRLVHANTKTGGTFATYAAAGWIRKNLSDAGFTVERTKGFAHKRHMTTGQKLSENYDSEIESPALLPDLEN